MRWLRRLFCRHGVYIDQLIGREHSADGETVTANCHKCGKLLAADCGLNLNASLDGYSPERKASLTSRKT